MTWLCTAWWGCLAFVSVYFHPILFFPTDCSLCWCEGSSAIWWKRKGDSKYPCSNNKCSRTCSKCHIGHRMENLHVYLTPIYHRFLYSFHLTHPALSKNPLTPHPDTSECESNHPADTRNLHLACLIHIHAIEGYRCVCWLTCSLSNPLPLFHFSISLMPGVQLKQVTGHSSNLPSRLVSSLFFLLSFHHARSNYKVGRFTKAGKLRKLRCRRSSVQQPPLPLQWAFIEYRDSEQ